MDVIWLRLVNKKRTSETAFINIAQVFLPVKKEMGKKKKFGACLKRTRLYVRGFSA